MAATVSSLISPSRPMLQRRSFPSGHSINGSAQAGSTSPFSPHSNTCPVPCPPLPSASLKAPARSGDRQLYITGRSEMHRSSFVGIDQIYCHRQNGNESEAGVGPFHQAEVTSASRCRAAGKHRRRTKTKRPPASIKGSRVTSVEELERKVIVGDVAAKAGVQVAETERTLEALASDSNGYREVGEYIASRGGVVTADELAPLLEPSLLASFDAPEGNVLYNFPSLQHTASEWLGPADLHTESQEEVAKGSYLPQENWSLSVTASQMSATLQSSPPPRQKQESALRDDYYVNVGYAIRTLREELPSMFYKDLTYDIYRDDIVFRDPLNSFSGIDNYKFIFWALRFHGRIFFRALWVDVGRIWQPTDKVIHVRWSVRGLPRVPWEAQGRFDGTSEYKLDKNGKIYDHKVDNVVMSNQQRFQPLTVMDLVRSMGVRTPATPTYFETLVLFFGHTYPYLSSFTWVRFYWALQGTVTLTEALALPSPCGG